MTTFRLFKMYRSNGWALVPAIRQAWKVARHA
jgi:hypothetical protein